MYPKPEHYYPTYWVIHLSRRGLTKTKELTIEFNLKDPWYIFPESVLSKTSSNILILFIVYNKLLYF